MKESSQLWKNSSQETWKILFQGSETLIFLGGLYAQTPMVGNDIGRNLKVSEWKRLLVIVEQNFRIPPSFNKNAASLNCFDLLLPMLSCFLYFSSFLNLISY
jgi:hypothetical protein